MILSDFSLVQEIEHDSLRIIPKPQESDIQPCSIDLHLADKLQTVGGKIIDISQDSYHLEPNEFILGSTFEYFEIPAHLCGQVEGKSSLARLGLSCHQTAGYIDAGFCGNITLELYNCSDRSIELSDNDKICQIIFHALTTECLRKYGSKGLNSHYQYSSGVVSSKWKS